MSPILDGMGYESLSTVVVLVIVIIAIAVWLPARTANGMKRAAEHRQDRYSPSLRIVEAVDDSAISSRIRRKGQQCQHRHSQPG